MAVVALVSGSWSSLSGPDDQGGQVHGPDPVQDENSLVEFGDPAPLASGRPGAPDVSRASAGNTLTLLVNGSGGATGDQYGQAVMGGDVDGDGMWDIAVSGPSAAVGDELDAGIVYIHLGEQFLATEGVGPDMAHATLLGESSTADFGWALSAIEDIDGDGLGDLVVGSPRYEADRGRAYIFSGADIAAGGEVSSSTILEGGDAGDQFGWSVAIAGDLNGDNKEDIAVGAPREDRAYVYFGPDYAPAERLVLKGEADSDFGHCVSPAGDLNRDGYDDLAVGAPAAGEDAGEVHLLYGWLDVQGSGTLSRLNNTLQGDSENDRFGWSIAGGEDLDGNKYDDIIVGAPGADRVHLYEGKDFEEGLVNPYLWNWPGDPEFPVSFESGVFNDVGASEDQNSYGMGNGDDGWDWGYGVFGSTASMSAVYGGTEGDGDGTTLDGSTRLEAIVGCTHTDPAPSTGTDSCAWGIEFEIDERTYEYIAGGVKAMLSFDWEASDTSRVDGLWGAPRDGTEEPCYIKARFTSSTGSTWLGTNLGGDADPEILYVTGDNNNPWGWLNGTFKTDVTHLLNGPGNYYLELGVKLTRLGSPWQNLMAEREGIIAFFDNVNLEIATDPIEVGSQIIGEAGTSFGYSVAYVRDMNGDGEVDVAVGSPENGAGSVHVFQSQTVLAPIVYSSSAELVNNGAQTGDDFGSAVAGGGDLNGDGLNEILVGAPKLSTSTGDLCVLTPNGEPTVKWVDPKGGELLNGRASLRVRCLDEEDGSDVEDVRYFYAPEVGDGPGNWHYIGNHSETGVKSGSIFSIDWRTSKLDDGYYYLRATVMDSVGLKTTAISDKIAVDNPDEPSVKFTSPDPSQTGAAFTGNALLSARATDPDDDIVGVHFYSAPYTEEAGGGGRAGVDLGNFTLIGSSYYPTDRIYSLVWDTTFVVDGTYEIMALAVDEAGLEAHTTFAPVMVNNPDAPLARVTYPAGGDVVAGNVAITARVTDLDYNILETGVTFSVGNEGGNWTPLGLGGPVPGQPDEYSVTWNSLAVPDGKYRVRVSALDTTGLDAGDTSGWFTVDNPTAPAIDVKKIESPVVGTVTIQAEVTDSDSELSEEGVSFFWISKRGESIIETPPSKDDEAWKKIGDAAKPSGGAGNVYTIQWDSTGSESGDGPNYWVKAFVKDATLLEAVDISPRFEVNNPDPPTVDLSVKEGEIKGDWLLEASASDPDGIEDILERGVSFYYTTDGGESWHFIGSDDEPDNKTGLFELMWNTEHMETETVDIKAVVVDSTDLKGEDIEEGREIHNQRDEYTPAALEGHGGSFSWLLLLLILLIVVVCAFIVAHRIKHYKKMKRLREALEKEEAVRKAKMDLLKDFPAIGAPYGMALGGPGAGGPGAPMMLGTGAPPPGAGAPAGAQLLLPAGKNIPIQDAGETPADISGIDAAKSPYAAAMAKYQAAPVGAPPAGAPAAAAAQPIAPPQGVMPAGGVGQGMYVMPQNPYAIAQQMFLQWQAQALGGGGPAGSPPAAAATIDVSPAGGPPGGAPPGSPPAGPAPGAAPGSPPEGGPPAGGPPGKKPPAQKGGGD